MTSTAVVVVGQFPPPLHGQAVVTAAVADTLETELDVARINLSAPGSRWRRAPKRAVKTVGAVAGLIRLRRRGPALIVSTDNGLGLAATLLLVGSARVLRYRVAVLHHTVSYVDGRSGLVAAIVRVGGAATVHVFACAGLADRFTAAYPGATTRAVGFDFAVDPVPADGAVAPGSTGPGLVVGHLSNLCAEKGLRDVFATVDEARARGLEIDLLLAGPPASAHDDGLLSQLLLGHEGRVRHLGRVTGEAKRNFFDAIDVFLFPSRYRHESLGIVVLEAEAHGVPVLALEAGCLVEGAIHGSVFARDVNFPARAAATLSDWADDRAALAAMGSAAATTAGPDGSVPSLSSAR